MDDYYFNFEPKCPGCIECRIIEWDSEDEDKEEEEELEEEDE